MKNCLVICYAPYETGAPEFMLRIRKYENAGQALDAYAETPCHDSILVDEETAKLIASMESEIIHSIKSGMMLKEALLKTNYIVNLKHKYMKTFSEEEVVNLISYACNMVTCENGSQFEEGYKWLIKNKAISNELASYIMAVIQSNRHK